MHQSKFLFLFVALSAVALATGCGGGGGGFQLADQFDPLVITSSSLPASQSGESIDIEIELGGGNGGPYVVTVIDGLMPRGVGTDDSNGRHHLTGVLLEDGGFNFTIQVTDTSTTPFFTDVQVYQWDVTQGPVQIVMGIPAIIPNADFDDAQKFPDVDALPTTVFSQFIAYDLIGAGGVPPYTCAILDDPADPDDNAGLPLGVSMPVNSCSLVGAPIQVGPGGKPFRITFGITDSVGNTGTRKLQWKIDTPPIIIANTALSDGQCGQSFSDGIQVVDGVPPFAYELTEDMPGDDGDADTTDNQNDDLTFQSPLAPIVNSTHTGGAVFTLAVTGPSANRCTPGGYPAETADGPNYEPYPSEGVYLRESGAGAGSFLGIPRRRGGFTVYTHAYSTLVPNERGQHAFKPLSHTIAASEPPSGGNDAFGMDPAFTLEGSFVGAPNYSNLPEAEATVLYNPDATSHAANGLQLLAVGGVPQDGWTDAPHELDRIPGGSSDVEGLYGWAADLNYDGLGTIPGLELFEPFGLFGTETQTDADNLVRTGRRMIELSVIDEQLPLSVRNAQSIPFGISVGPDAVIITESVTSFSGTTTSGSGDSSMHDTAMTIKHFEVVAGSGSVSPLLDADMSQGTTIPTSAGLSGSNQVGQLLSGTSPGDLNLDLLRITVNPNGWWNDQHAINPKGARAMARGDNNNGRPENQANGYRDNGGGWHSNATSCELPDVPGVSPDVLNGIRNDGGLMYAFRSANRFGLFIVRKDASVYVPFALEEGAVSGIQKFGDGIVSSGNDDNLLMVPISVSPDGRFGCAKLTTSTSISIHTQSSRSSAYLVIFSLTGEKVFGGSTYQIFSADAGNGNYMYSTSVTMTNSHVYWLSGNYSSTYASWRDHYIHRATYRSGATFPAPVAALATQAGGSANWTLAAGTPMQTPFQKWDTPTTNVRSTSFATGGLTFVTFEAMQQDMYLYDGWNMGENSTAPVPFRVSADGNHCALLAGPRTTSTSGSDVMSHLCWVDSGNGFRQVSSNTKRHCPQGASRGYGLSRGPINYAHWGRYDGPTTGFEISDDGRHVAWCYNKIGSVSATTWNANWHNERQNVLAVSTTNGGSDPWTSTTGEKEVTKNTFGGAAIKWRFGSLVFTKDNNGLIFWGGFSSKGATSTTLNNAGNQPRYGDAPISAMYTGTYYAYNLTSAADQVKGVMPTTAGGIGSFPTYTAAAPFIPATPTYTTNGGVIKPMGGFLSKNRDYFYVVNMHPNSSSDQTQSGLLGINVENLNGASTASGHKTGQGFKPSAYPNRRSFVPTRYYQPHYALDWAYYVPAHTQGSALQVMNNKTGWVYWMSHYQRLGPTNSTSATSTFSSGPAIRTYWGDYGYVGMQIEGFNAQVGGPIARLSGSHLGSDTSSRNGQYLITSDDGTKVAYVWGTGGSIKRHNQERVGWISKIGFDASTGSIDPNFDNTDSAMAFAVEGSSGRAGESMAFDSGGTKLYYAFKSGSNNENNTELVELLVNPATGAKTYKRVTPTRRYNVLYSGR